MPRRAFGRTGVRTTLFGLGCFPLGGLPDEGPAVDVILRALDAAAATSTPRRATGGPERDAGRQGARGPARSPGLPRDEDPHADRRRRPTRRRGQPRAPGRRAPGSRAGARGEGRRRISRRWWRRAARSRRWPRRARRASSGSWASRGTPIPTSCGRRSPRWPFDAILFPLNCVDPHHLSFEKGTLPAAVEQGARSRGDEGVRLRQPGEAGARSRALPPLRVRAGRRHHHRRVPDRRGGRSRGPRRAGGPSSRRRRQDEAAPPETLPHRGKGVEWYKRA